MPTVAQHTTIQEALIREGFRNVGVWESEDRLLVCFENDRYRFLPDALIKSGRTIQPLAKDSFPVEIIILRLHQPVSSIKYLNKTTDSLSFFYPGSMNSGMVNDQDWRKIRRGSLANSSLWNVDLVVKPEINWQIGNYLHPFRFLINLLPVLQTSMWKGMFLHAQFIVPTIDVHYTNNYKYFRPGILSAHQLFRMPGGVFGSLSAGLYSDFRYGSSLQVARFFWEGRIMLEANLHYTGYGTYLNHGGTDLFLNRYDDPTLVIGPMNYWSGIGAIHFLFPEYDLFTKISHGKWLYGQNVTEVLVFRKFNEVNLGFMIQDFGKENNFGISLSLPLYPYKYFFNKKIRIRPNESLNFSYLAKNSYAYDFRTGWALRGLFEDFNPRHLRKSIINSNN